MNNSSNEVNYIHSPETHNFSAARQILPFLLGLKQINSVLDVGCGTGTWLAIAKELGVLQILGIDGTNLTASDLKIPYDNFLRRDLTAPLDLNKKFDLLLCLEVAEHLPMENAEAFIDTLTQHSDFIIFSAAIPGQGGQDHLNEQWPGYWQKLFEKKEYYPSEILRDKFWNNKEVEWWYKQNMFIYAPKAVLTALNLPIADEVRAIVHPELLTEKLQFMDKLYGDVVEEVRNPGFRKAFKRLLKSIIN